jgi:hypothetical protein
VYQAEAGDDKDLAAADSSDSDDGVKEHNEKGKEVKGKDKEGKPKPKPQKKLAIALAERKDDQQDKENVKPKVSS